MLITVRNEVAKVMFLHLSVRPQGGVGVSASVHSGIPHPPSRHTTGVDTPKSRHPPLEQTITPQEQTPPRSRHSPGSRHPQGADTPLGADTPQEQTPPGADTSRDTATAADGTHPT